MYVSETRAIQAVNAGGQPVTTSAWVSSDPSIVSVSGPEPEILHALAPGQATISVGSATAEVTVWPEPPASGTVEWSVPGDVVSVAPAFPTESLVDVFTLGPDGRVQAITGDGLVRWTVNAGEFYGLPPYIAPDFKGGLLIHNDAGIFALDAMTGQPGPIYSPTNGTALLDDTMVPHPDGTVFALEINVDDTDPRAAVTSVIGIDPATGSRKFSVPLQDYEPYYSPFEAPDSPCPGASLTYFRGGGAASRPIVAGDGFAYVTYFSPEHFVDCDRSAEYVKTTHIKMVRVSSQGAYSKLHVQDVDAAHEDLYQDAYVYGNMITDAGTGTFLSWKLEWVSESGTASGYGMAISSGASVSLVGTSPVVPGQRWVLGSMLQLEDNSFAAAVDLEDETTTMVSIGNDGALRWSVANETPLMATEGGGVLTQSGNLYDATGANVGQAPNPGIRSWRGNTYVQDSGIQRLVSGLIDRAMSLWAHVAGSPSSSHTAGKPWHFRLVWKNDCTGGHPECGFIFYPDNPDVLPALAVDANSRATLVKSTALEALKKAYSDYPVNVTEGRPNTSHHRATVVDGYFVNPEGLRCCGYTSFVLPITDSNIYYQTIMEQAQWALPIVITTPQQTQATLARADLFSAIGAGIGNTAAHEIAHHFFVSGSALDDSSTHTYNGRNCEGEEAPWNYGRGPIQWGPVTADALKQRLGTGGY
jgi:hypothetical protein